MEGVNRNFIHSLINECENDAFSSIFKNCETIKSELERTGEYKAHRDIYNIYSDLAFLFHGKYINFSMKRTFFGCGLFVSKLKELIEDPNDDFLRIISRHACYSKGYEGSKVFVSDNYDFKLNSLGCSVNNYMENNFSTALRILKTTNGKW